MKIRFFLVIVSIFIVSEAAAQEYLGSWNVLITPSDEIKQTANVHAPENVIVSFRDIDLTISLLSDKTFRMTTKVSIDYIRQQSPIAYIYKLRVRVDQDGTWSKFFSYLMLDPDESSASPLNDWTRELWQKDPRQKQRWIPPNKLFRWKIISVDGDDMIVDDAGYGRITLNRVR